MNLFNTPAVGFEQPFEMLEACHDRVRRSLDLLARLVDHVQHQGHDARSRSAARDVLRYFDLAAPQHHDDEERQVFPRVLAGGDAALRAAVQQLRADHLRMTRTWALLRPVLEDWAGASAVGPADATECELVQAFRALYAAHMPIEEALVFPAARAACDADTLAVMGGEMQGRRRAAARIPP